MSVAKESQFPQGQHKTNDNDLARLLKGSKDKTIVCIVDKYTNKL